jgi:hypothetical protein
MHYGSQEDVAFLQSVVDSVVQKHFDIIIDDGGHTMKQEIISINTLVSSVRPGGLYIIEDLETSHMKSFGGHPSDETSNTTITLLKRMIDDFQDGKPGPKWNTHLFNYIYSYEIGPGIVFLRTRTA